MGYSLFAIINGILQNYLNKRFSLKIQGKPHKDVFYTRGYLERKLYRYGWKVIKQNWEENKKTPYIVTQKF